MKSLFFIFCSGITGALYGLSYKLRQRLGYPIEAMLFLFAIFSVLFSLLFILIMRESIFSLDALLLGIPYGLATIASLSLCFIVTNRGRLNITWLAIQFSVLIPFSVSIFFYGEQLHCRALYGIGCIFTSIVMFSLGRAKHSITPPVLDRKTGVQLALASFATGIAMSFPKIYAAASPEGGLFTLFLFRGLSMVVAAYLVGRVRGRSVIRPKLSAGIFLLTAFMSINALLLGAFIILALKRINGSVAFPLRSAVNVFTLFLLSFILFRESFTLLEGMSSVVALAGIILISSSLG